jgi:hypothetical protein
MAVIKAEKLVFRLRALQKKLRAMQHGAKSQLRAWFTARSHLYLQISLRIRNHVQK